MRRTLSQLDDVCRIPSASRHSRSVLGLFFCLHPNVEFSKFSKNVLRVKHVCRNIQERRGQGYALFCVPLRLLVGECEFLIFLTTFSDGDPLTRRIRAALSPESQRGEGAVSIRFDCGVQVTRRGMKT